MATLDLPETLTDSQIEELVAALKKSGKVPPNLSGLNSEGSSMVIPKIPNFSAEVPIPKGEVSFEVWRFEINCLLKDGLHKETAITQGVRKSLRGEAASILMNSLGHKAVVGEILNKFEGIYGTLETGEELLQQFYNATQGSGESISSWGCRLEDILTKAVSLKKLNNTSKNDMLRTKFWSGLSNSILKNAIRYKYESISSFDELRKEVRKMEQELVQDSSSGKKKSVQHQVQTVNSNVPVDKIQDKLASLEQKLEALTLGLTKTDESSTNKQLLSKMEELSQRLSRLEQGSGELGNPTSDSRIHGQTYTHRGNTPHQTRGQGNFQGPPRSNNGTGQGHSYYRGSYNNYNRATYQHRDSSGAQPPSFGSTSHNNSQGHLNY